MHCPFFVLRLDLWSALVLGLQPILLFGSLLFFPFLPELVPCRSVRSSWLLVAAVFQEGLLVAAVVMVRAVLPGALYIVLGEVTFVNRDVLIPGAPPSCLWRGHIPVKAK